MKWNLAMLRLSWLLLGCAVVVAPVTVAPVTAADERPNVVLIMSDDMGFSDIGCYGGEIDTPVLNGLAEHGLRFTQFYNTARCCPTRASLLTGLYQHQAGIGHMTGDNKLVGYQGDLNRNCRTIAEVMKSAGYATMMAGKWHVTKHTHDITDEALKFNWPRQRGFDRFYGTIIGAGSFYDPTSLVRENSYITPANDTVYRPKNYYYTDAISDNATMFLNEHHQQASDQPFFLYVAYTAAHWPMHALPEDIAKYRGRYDEGYGPIRAARYQRLQEMGIIQDKWGLNPQVGNWEQVEHKEWEARCMEVYAAMVDNMDRGIGRIVETLKQNGDYENTLVLFLQDNGGCAEGMGRSENAARSFIENGPKNPRPLAADELQPRLAPPMQTRDGRVVRGGVDVMPGPADTYIGYGENWANVSNTPFRLYKHWVHEGGISTPLIAHWPRGIQQSRRGALEHQPGHLIDVMATCVDVARAQYPQEVDDQPIHPLQGVSLVPAFHGASLDRGRPIFFEHEGNRAVREERWKLVARGAQGAWELYDMLADRSELHDLAAEHPEQVERLSKAWDVWARQAHVLPWPWDPKPKKYSNKKRFELSAGDELTGNRMPDTARRSLSIRTSVEQAGGGVVLAQGGVAHGFALLLDESKHIVFCLRRGGELTTVKSAAPVTADQYDLHCELKSQGQLEVRVDGRVVLSEKLPGLLRQTPLDGCCAGFDSNDPVGEYPRTNRFSGRLGTVTLELGKRSN